MRLVDDIQDFLRKEDHTDPANILKIVIFFKFLKCYLDTIILLFDIFVYSVCFVGGFSGVFVVLFRGRNFSVYVLHFWTYAALFVYQFLQIFDQSLKFFDVADNFSVYTFSLVRMLVCLDKF